MGFIGVTTGSSSIRDIFPRWAEVLGLPTSTLVGHDITLDAPDETYRHVVRQIKDDPNHRGALVTTHKMNLFRAAGDLFDEFDPLVQTFREISSIAKRGSRLVGAAKDPVTVDLALREFLPTDHFTHTGGAALILGSGGAGSALSYQLGKRADAPTSIICTALEPGSLAHCRELHERGGIDQSRMRYEITSGCDQVDRLLGSLPPASLVVNATGMGKDRPGSPLSDAACFPERAVVWDFNYRGTLEFLQQARQQQAARALNVQDGWRYFIHGWTQVISDVFEVNVPPETVARLGEVAAEVR